MSAPLDYRCIATLLEYIDGNAQTLPSGVVIEFQRAAPAEPQPAQERYVLVRSPRPGRVKAIVSGGAVREAEAIGEILCGRQRVAIVAPFTGHVSKWLQQEGQFVEFDQALVVLKPQPQRTSRAVNDINSFPSGPKGEGRAE